MTTPIHKPTPTGDRAALLARMADFFMEHGCLPPLPPGCLDFRASLWPERPSEPREVHFSATWASVTLVCLRSLDGYSLEGGLHRTERDDLKRPGVPVTSNRRARDEKH